MITITLNNVAAYTKGVKYDSYIKSYFANFAFEGWPYITGGASQFDGNQLILLDNLAGRNTKAIVMDGRNFSYHFSKHVMSGTLQTIKLAILGDSYKSGGSFTTDSAGHIINVAAPVEIKGLSIANGVGVKGDFHNLTAGLMGGVAGGNKADATILKETLASEAINLRGSKGSGASPARNSPTSCAAMPATTHSMVASARTRFTVTPARTSSMAALGPIAYGVAPMPMHSCSRQSATARFRRPVETPSTISRRCSATKSTFAASMPTRSLAAIRPSPYRQSGIRRSCGRTSLRHGRVEQFCPR